MEEEIIMTLKKTLLGTAAMFALALPVTAQSDATGTTDMECAGEIVDNVCMDAAMDAETVLETETDADVAADDTMTPPVRDLRDSSAFSGMTVADVVGMPVESADTEIVGEIDYIVASPDGHEAVIGIGGFLGFGEHTVALPLGAFSIDAARNVLVLDGFTEDELTAMPEIDESGLESLPGEYVIG